MRAAFARAITVVFGVFVTIWAAQPAWAQVPPPVEFENLVGIENVPREQLEPAVGSFGEYIPVKVPAFHGIEPTLGLSYNSMRSGALAGVGWRIAGISEIERASPRRGAPRYDETDIFLLDGQELVACVPGMVSPSCATGGTHATKVETYLRIRAGDLGNLWEVWRQDGTKVTYEATLGPGPTVFADTFRWSVARVEDTHGNLVQYGYWCDGVEECYADTIAYNGTTIRFYWELRPDPMSYGIGSGAIQGNYRPRTIDVLVGGARARAYTLGYATSGSTRRSILSSIQEFGRDAVLDPGNRS